MSKVTVSRNERTARSVQLVTLTTGDVCASYDSWRDGGRVWLVLEHIGANSVRVYDFQKQAVLELDSARTVFRVRAHLTAEFE